MSAIKKHRKKAGLTQKQFSDLFKIPIDTIKNWESGRRKPPEWVEKLIINELKRTKGKVKTMTFTTFKSERRLNIDELREVLVLMENQETTDRYTSTSIDINGDYAHIQVDIDEDGNVIVN